MKKSHRVALALVSIILRIILRILINNNVYSTQL